MEVELKLLLAPEHNQQLRQHPLLAGLATRTQPLLAHYFDTPDLHLLRHGAGLRVRKEDGVWMQTMKAGGSVQNGLHQRNEWEGPVSRPWPQLGKLRKLIGDDAHWRDVLAAPHFKQRLEALFAVVVEREIWQLDYAGSQIELVLDCGHIERHGQQLPLNEIELELRQGKPEHLFALALQLLERLPLQLSNVNKAQRGYSLCRQTGTQAHHARALALPADATLDAARHAILFNCLQQVQDNEQAVIHSDHAEALHQMRVGVRRLRSALKLFRSVAPCPPQLKEDWRWLAQVLGKARDWEVLGSATLARVQASPGGPAGLHDLPALVQQQVAAHRQQAAQALRSPRYTRLLLQMGHWLLAGAASSSAAAMQADGTRIDAAQGEATHGTGEEAGTSAAEFSRHTMQRLRKTLLKRARGMNDTDAASIHRTRIAAKQSRYTLEFFHTLYRGKALRKYLATLEATQEALGQHNDLVVADRLLQQLGSEHPAATPAARHIAFARGYLRALQEQQPTDLQAVQAGLRELPRF
ncbi:CHAD domain-containing protein [Pseudoduganella sp. FT93W]|uniref:CHAD domain-containing protein n=1 Tax=Duganella fentianensis TaxID=2692177 RepID=A0A845I1R2_9BURK|nr:CYTH and CHAD domain-containing protein [Duganella fentianensis]MYN47169.1 CHAD domain-containing protein [Duganella fentianensis]